jgi:hypothetical protein
MDRRDWLKSAAGGVGALALGPTLFTEAAGASQATRAGRRRLPQAGGSDRWEQARAVREAAADRAFAEPMPEHPSNGEERDYPYLAAFTMCLPHDQWGEVDRQAYRAQLRALESGRQRDFDRIPLGTPNGVKLLNPQGGLAFDLLGPDSHGTVTPPAPRIDGAQNSAEAAELYWAALLRDVPFARFGDDPLAAAAAADLSGYSDYRGPKAGGAVTPATLLRGDTPGDLVGPYMSQFMLEDVQFGTTRIAHRHDTVAPGVDYLTDFGDWLPVQNGQPRPTTRDFANTRYIRTPRDLAHYTHFDVAYQPYLYAFLILAATPGGPALLDAGNPYKASANQYGFATLGGPHVTSLLGEATNRAIKHVQFHKWYVHRRLRPDAFGARLEVHLARDPGRYDGILHAEILESAVLERVRSLYGTSMLPQAFPEGPPSASAYPAGHSTVAGACVTILKAWFDESFVLPDPVVPSEDGTALVPYTGTEQLTIGGELDKLAANIGTGRTIGGIHWRSDNTVGYTLGEEIAIGILRDHKDTLNEDVTFSLTRFDGARVTI